MMSPGFQAVPLFGRGWGCKCVWVWVAVGSGKWYSACLRFFHNDLPFQPLNLALGKGMKWWFREAGRTSLAWPLFPRGTKRKKGS